MRRLLTLQAFGSIVSGMLRQANALMQAVRRCCANLLAPGRATEFHESKILRVETSTSSDLCSAILPLAMLAVLSPAKTLDMSPSASNTKSTPSSLLSKRTEEILASLKKMPAKELKKMMKLSDELAKQTAERFVYSLYLESILLATSSIALQGREALDRRIAASQMLSRPQAVCRWTLKGVDDKSTPFLLRKGLGKVSKIDAEHQEGFCSFVVVSFPTPSRRSLCLRLAVSRVSAGLSSLPLAADFAVAFVDIADLSGEERFKVDFLELRNSELQVVAVAKLHSAAQRRWTPEPVPPPSQAKFLDYTVDAQASRLYEHIAAAAGIAVQSPQRPGLASAAKARDQLSGGVFSLLTVCFGLPSDSSSLSFENCHCNGMLSRSVSLPCLVLPCAEPVVERLLGMLGRTLLWAQHQCVCEARGHIREERQASPGHAGRQPWILDVDRTLVEPPRQLQVVCTGEIGRLCREAAAESARAGNGSSEWSPPLLRPGLDMLCNLHSLQEACILMAVVFVLGETQVIFPENLESSGSAQAVLVLAIAAVGLPFAWFYMWFRLQLGMAPWPLLGLLELAAAEVRQLEAQIEDLLKMPISARRVRELSINYLQLHGRLRALSALAGAAPALILAGVVMQSIGLLMFEVLEDDDRSAQASIMVTGLFLTLISPTLVAFVRMAWVAHRVPSSPMSPPKGGASEDERLLWSLLGAFGCAPETRCSCRWPEDDAEAARRHKEALFPRPRGACSEETIDLRSDPPASGAAKTSNPGLARARPVTDVRWFAKFKAQPSKAACLAFDGPAFRGFAAKSFSKADEKQAQASVRILCALYGVLKPYDLIRPYRLEMTSKLRGKTMYDVWGDTITDALTKELKLSKAKFLVNCASQEFWKAVRPKKLPSSCLLGLSNYGRDEQCLATGMQPFQPHAAAEGIQVIAAGVSRTSTQSLSLALAKLGHKTLHAEGFHPKLQLAREAPDIVDRVTKAARRSFAEHSFEVLEPTLEQLEMLNVTALVDIPWSQYGVELHRRYPKAKVIVTVRDKESWFRSYWEHFRWGALLPPPPFPSFPITQPFPLTVLYQPFAQLLLQGLHHLHLGAVRPEALVRLSVAFTGLLD
eukprot:s383_g32.t3